MKNVMKIKLNTIDIILICLTFIKFSFVPRVIFTGFMYIVIVYCLIKYIKELFDDKLLFSILGGYLLVITYSTFLNMQKFTWTLSAFMGALQIIAVFITYKGSIKKNETIQFVAKISLFFATILAVNDLFMFILPYNYMSPSEQYIVGNKFYVVYFHYLLVVLINFYTYKKNTYKRLPIILYCYSFGISLLIHCTTGIIMGIFFIIITLVPEFIKRIAGSPLVITSALIIINTLIWGSFSLFKNPTVQNIIVNVFHKSANLTGRQKLYDVELLLISRKPLFGYGYNSDIFRNMFGYGNAQNGLFDIVIQAGIIGASLYFIALLLVALRNNKESNSYILRLYIMALVIASTVEISLEKEFVLGIAIIYAINSESRRKRTHWRK